MIVAGYFAFVVSLTFLGTVRWVRIGPDEPHAARRVPARAPHSPSAVSRDAEPATEPADRHLRPRPTWSQP